MVVQLLAVEAGARVQMNRLMMLLHPSSVLQLLQVSIALAKPVLQVSSPRKVSEKMIRAAII